MKQIDGTRLQRQQETPELIAVVLTVLWSPIQAVLTRVLIELYSRGEQPVPVAARSKAQVCGRSPAENVDSNPTGGMGVCLLWVLGVVRKRSLRRAEHSSRGVLPTVVRRCVWSRNVKNEEAIIRIGSQNHRKKEVEETKS